jgi:hypothetical protein
MKLAVFWIIAPCSVVEVSDVSEAFALSNIRAVTVAGSKCETSAK